jgi:uncharacterized SAM-binding protein YcdF (DUF218 family)
LRWWPTEDDPKLNQKRWAVVGLIALVLGLTLLIVKEYGRVSKQPINSWTEDSSADCAVVLTGGANRIREGIDLLAQRAIQKLIISGVHPKANLRDIFPQLPFYGSVNEQDIVLEKRSTTTYGNAQQTLPLVEALRCRDLVLVTSQVHMYRAYRTFRGNFPVQIPIIQRAVIAGRAESAFDEVLFESFKSLFYSLWAY